MFIKKSIICLVASILLFKFVAAKELYCFHNATVPSNNNGYQGVYVKYCEDKIDVSPQTMKVSHYECGNHKLNVAIEIANQNGAFEEIGYKTVVPAQTVDFSISKTGKFRVRISSQYGQSSICRLYIRYQ